jgi:hypothetical protein
MLRADDAVETASAMETHPIRRTVYLMLAFVSGTGLVMSFVNSMTSDVATSHPERIVRFFTYFTIESNILVLLAAAVLAAGAQSGVHFVLLHLDALLGITVTGIVFATILAPDGADVGTASVLLHYIAPPLAVLSWLLLGPWPARSRALIRPALLWPLGYLAWVLIWGAITDWYPYEFIDVAVHGYGRVLLNALLVLILGILLLLAFIAVNRRHRVPV